MKTKYIFVTGGVVSGLGKGITVAALGRLLKARGYKVTTQKFDPYINIDPGTMSPTQHGEVFVTEDGAETDLDLGHYERFIDENLTVNSSVTAGKIYWYVLNKERRGEYHGETIQVIPHITNVIKECINRAGSDAGSDIVISEIGGTVGDIESLPFLEAIRQTARDVGRENVIFVHLTLVPYLSVAGEMKTKPSQHSVKELLSIGIQPDVIVCRTERKMDAEMCEKLALFCNVDRNCIIQNNDAGSIYEVPLLLEEEGFADIVCAKLRLDAPEPDLTEWRGLVDKLSKITSKTVIGIVGKYVRMHDAYLSVAEALCHAGVANDTEIKIRWINPDDLVGEGVNQFLQGLSGIVVPGEYGESNGYNEKEIEFNAPGILNAIRFARVNKIPFFGINMGLQYAAAEFASNALMLSDLNGIACAETVPVAVEPVPEHYDITKTVNSMKLGAQPCVLKQNTLARAAYGEDVIYERHRHRINLSEEFREIMGNNGLIISGSSPDGRRVEIAELPASAHPWFVGVQFHPEFKSRLNRPSPLFKAFVRACMQI